MMLLDQKMHFFKHYPIRYLQNSLRIEHKSERTIDRRSILQTWMTRWPDLMRIYFHCKLGWRHILLKWYNHMKYIICTRFAKYLSLTPTPQPTLVFDLYLTSPYWGVSLGFSSDPVKIKMYQCLPFPAPSSFPNIVISCSKKSSLQWPKYQTWGFKTIGHKPMSKVPVALSSIDYTVYRCTTSAKQSRMYNSGKSLICWWTEWPE